MKNIHHVWQGLSRLAAILALTLGMTWLLGCAAPQPAAAPLIELTPTASALPEKTIPPEVTPTQGLTPTQVIPPTQVIAQEQAQNDDWHGTKVIRSVEFPQTPVEAGIYTHSESAPATIESAQALAKRFGIQGNVYQNIADQTGTVSFLVTDGKQRLFMTSSGLFSYFADFSTATQEAEVSAGVASSAIDSFLKAHAFDFAYQLQPASGIGAGWFYVIPLTVDGRALRFDFGRTQGLTIHIGPDGKMIQLDAILLNLDPNPAGNFGLISAEQAWQKFLQDVPFGMIQSSHSAGTASSRLFWHHLYPDNQQVTVYGPILSFASAEAGKAPLITADGYLASGNVSGMEALAPNTFAEIQGQFVTENNIRRLQVESWQVFDQASQQYLQGGLRSEAGKTIFVSADASYELADAPADLTLPLENVSITAIVKGTSLDWQDMLYFQNPNQGGGGGCGGGFAKLNLDGSPVPWPTFVPVITPTALPSGQRIDNLRGLLSVSIYEQTNGSRRTEFIFFTPKAQYILEAQNLEPLLANHNRQVILSGTVSGYTSYQIPVLTVEKYEIPSPDVKFQILRGTQKVASVDGQPVTLFTSQDGTAYAQMMPAGIPDSGLVGLEGDPVMYETLIYPDETFGGYPVMRVYSGQLATNPKTGQPAEMTISADKPAVMPEPLPASGPAPTLTIDTIELVYYTPDPNYANSYPLAMSATIQPVWRFSGHFSDGSETEILIQALKPDYLLPEPAPALQCG